MKSLFFLVVYFFKLIGIKTINDLRKSFGNPDISMPLNSTRDEWINALRKLARDNHLELGSISYKFIAEEYRQNSKIIFTHIWFLRPFGNIMVVKEYDIGQPEIRLEVLKTKSK